MSATTESSTDKKGKNLTWHEFTGVSAPYDEPESPEIVLDTASVPFEECVERVLDYLLQNGYIKESRSNRSTR